MDDSDLRLDGNAVAGLLMEILQVEITTTATTCGHCGATRQFGAEVVYSSAMGTIVRCVGCEGVLIRIARIGERVWLDLRGVACFQIIMTS
jgi:hypothetical protein